MVKKALYIGCFFFFLSGCTEGKNNASVPIQPLSTHIPSPKETLPPTFSSSPSVSVSSSCQITREKKHLEGNSMEPMIKNGSWTTLLKGYYDCGLIAPQKGDIVAGVYGGNKLPLIKTVVATHSDQVQIINKKLVVNGQEVKNSAQQSYTFSDAELKMLQMYIINTTIPEKTVFLLGDNVHNSIDSRKFGAISIQDIIGKFEIL